MAGLPIWNCRIPKTRRETVITVSLRALEKPHSKND